MSPDGSRRGATPVLFTHYGEEGIRGSERVLLDLLRHVDRDAFRPVVWCNTETMSSAVRALDVETFVSEMPVLLGWSAPRFALAEYRRLRREAATLIGRHGIRVVHANSGAPNQWMVPAARHAGIPSVAHLHAHYLLRDRCTMLVHQASMIVGCSRAVVAPFEDDGVPVARLRVIYNGVDIDRLSAGDATGLRADLGIDAGETVVAMAGALVALKGFAVVLRAARVLKDRGSCPVFLFMGTGPEEQRLRALVAELGLTDRVHFLGARSDVGAVFRDVADVVVAPSYKEAFGLVVAEAAVFGVPSVVSDIPGLREIVDHGVSGFVVRAGDATAIADAIVQLATDPTARRTMGDRARTVALERFSSQQMSAQFGALYRELVSPARAASLPAANRWKPWQRLGTQWVRNRLHRASPPLPR